MERKELTWYQMEDLRTKHHNENKRIKNGVAMGAALGDFLNGASSDDIADMMQYLTQMEHRTIQQEAMGLFLEGILAFANQDERRIDARNRIAVNKAKQIKSFMDENYITAKMPCI